MSWILKRLGGRFSRSLRLPTPSAPKKSEKALLIHVRESVFLKEDMIVDSRRVSNREGLGWMERMERDAQARRLILDQLVKDSKAQNMINEKFETNLRAQRIVIEAHGTILDQLVKDSKAQKIINDEEKRRWFKARATDIEDSGHSQAEEATLARSERYQAIHRGNIIEDLEIVEFMKAETPQDRYESLSAAFEALYEVSIRYEHRIVHVPDLVLRTFNILADTKSYWGWLNDSITQDEARTICRGIISRWLEFVDAGEGEYPEDEIKGEFEKLVRFRSI